MRIRHWTRYASCLIGVTTIFVFMTYLNNIQPQYGRRLYNLGWLMESSCISQRLQDRKARIESLCWERQLAPMIEGPIGEFRSMRLVEMNVETNSRFSWLVYCPVHKATSSDWYTRITKGCDKK